MKAKRGTGEWCWVMDFESVGWGAVGRWRMVGGVVVEQEEVERSEELEVVELHLAAEEFWVGEGVLDAGEEAEILQEGVGEAAVAFVY